jgi:iron complex transport system ATP-binding protein
MLDTKNIQYSIGKKTILSNISAQFLPGQFSMILGPNGSGKSTFLKIFSGELKGYSGSVTYSNQPIATQKKETLARYRAVMSQQPELGFPLTVEEVVMMGRYPHFNFQPAANDERICREVMKKMQLAPFAERNYLTLSGGEKQRVQFARVLAQIWEKPPGGCRYLFLDEPLTSLDINYQQEFLQTAKAFALDDTVLVAVVHDINLALQYADNLLFFKEGQLTATGKPGDIISETLIREVFGVETAIITNPVSGSPLVVYR